MPTAIVNVFPQVGGDYGGEKSGPSAPASAILRAVGYFAGIFPVLPFDQGWMGRFEVPIPNGATVTSVKVSIYQNSGSGGVDRMAGGLLAPDGKWNVSSGTFDSSKYASVNAMPWPEGSNGTNLDPAAWYGSSPAFNLVQFGSSPGGSYMTFGEGTSVDNPTPGLVAKFQSYLNTWGPSLRTGSQSGTDLPVAVCWYRAFAFPSTSQQFSCITALSATPSQRPTLTVTWTEVITPSSVSGKAQVQPIVSARKEIR